MNQIVFIVLALGVGYLVYRLFFSDRVSPETARAQVEAGTAVLVDVREPSEWAGGVAAPAVLLPLSDLRGGRKSWRPFLEKHRDKRILVYCHLGGRSGLAASILKAEGFSTGNIGGFTTWLRRGLPVRKP